MGSLKRSADEALQVEHRDEEEMDHETVPRDGPLARGNITLESAPETRNNELNLTGALPKLVVLDLDKTVRFIRLQDSNSGAIGCCSIFQTESLFWALRGEPASTMSTFTICGVADVVYCCCRRPSVAERRVSYSLNV